MEWDSETGLYHTWFRQYDVNQGRWMGVDPLPGSPDNPQSDRLLYLCPRRPGEPRRSPVGRPEKRENVTQALGKAFGEFIAAEDESIRAALDDIGWLPVTPSFRAPVL